MGIIYIKSNMSENDKPIIIDSSIYLFVTVIIYSYYISS